MALVPTEYLWIIPLAAPFVMGLLVGVIVKRGLKLIIALVVLVIALAAVGYTQLPTVEGFLRDALSYLPIIWAKASPLVNILPYSSASFLLGLAIGLWKG